MSVENVNKFMSLPKRVRANYLRKAANRINNQPELAKYTFTGLKNGSYCAVGALGKEYGDNPHFLAVFKGPIGDLVVFNDSDATTQKDVVKKLRSIARQLEHGGEFNV